MKKYIFLATLFAACFFNAGAISISSLTPGNLADRVGADTLATSLTLEGSMDIRDFEFILHKMPDLRTLDMAQVAISAYSGDATFLGYTSAEANTIPTAALMLPSLSEVTLPQSLQAIGEGAFASSSIRSISIPQGVTSIGSSAFAECASLQSVVIPSSVKELGTGVFQGCSALKSATFEGSLPSIPASTFSRCSALGNVTLPANLSAIGDNAFNGCSSLDAVALPSSLTEIGTRAFYGSGLTAVDLSSTSSLHQIAPWAFAQCPGLTKVSLPAALTSIGKGAFYLSPEVQLSDLPESINRLGAFALDGADITSPDIIADTAIDSIGAYAMAGWQHIQSIKLPDTLTYLGDGAMQGWSSLQTINAQTVATVPTLGSNVFEGIDQPSVALSVPSDLIQAFLATPQWKEFDVQTGTTDHVEAAEDLFDAATANVDVRIDGDMIYISAHQPIAGVLVYDIAGRSYAVPTRGTDTTETTVDTSAISAPVIILSVSLADGSVAPLKISRN